MLTGAALVFTVNVAGGILNWVYQRAGRVTTQIFLFVIALLGSLYWHYNGLVPGLSAWVAGAIAIYVGAIAVYETFLRYFPLFAGPANNTPTVSTPSSASN